MNDASSQYSGASELYEQSRVFKVAVNSPAPDLYSYLAPPGLKVETGQMVRVPFGGRELTGYVMEPEDPTTPPEKRSYKLKEISAVLAAEPLFDLELTKLVKFVANYYFYPPGLCVNEILPGGLSPKLKVELKLTKKALAAGLSACLGAPKAGAKAKAKISSKGGPKSVPLFGPEPKDLPEGELENQPYASPISENIDPAGDWPDAARLSSSEPAAAMAGKDQSPREIILRRLFEAGAIALSEFQPWKKVVSQLVKEELAELAYGLDSQGTGFSYEWRLSVRPEPANEAAESPGSGEKKRSSPLKKPVRLGPKEQLLWDLVKKAPPTPLSHYRQILAGNVLVQARSLERKGLIDLERRERFRDDPERALSVSGPTIEALTPDQLVAVEAIGAALDKRENKGFLLFGVTGSGKTEVYLQATAKALDAGRGVLWLAPEIALTMGLEGRIRQRFPSLAFSVLHSGLSQGQRHDHWLAIRRGDCRLAIGARSAVFAPMADIGLIVVDEEHDWAYKQDDGLRYQGRDLAAWRAKEAGAALILGSATPSVETYRRALNGQLTLLRLQSRPGQAVMPKVKLIDRRSEGKGGRDPIAPEVRAALKETFERGEQVLMFINRRGLANMPICLSCGQSLKCPHCSLTLTLHSNPDERASQSEDDRDVSFAEMKKHENLLICHGCGYRAALPKQCPQCESFLVRYLGVGTESLIREMEKSFDKKGLRLDTDSAKRKGGLKAILDGFAKGEADFLVGTQMAAKGHDFSNLTMVGVVEADLGLNVADFRAAERTFQLLCQVSGRAGRRERPGQVYIQTLCPEHYALTAAQEHDYQTFFENEIAVREELGYPPFARMALLRFSGPGDAETAAEAEASAELGRKLIEAKNLSGLDIFGPAPSPMSKLREKYRHQIMLRAFSAEERHRLLRRWLPMIRSRLSKNVRLSVDIDPYNLL